MAPAASRCCCSTRTAPAGTPRAPGAGAGREALPGPLWPYGLQAAIAACHARATRAEETDWVKIAALYDALSQAQPSPIVELNRAVALGMAFGPEVGLELLDQIEDDPTLTNCHLLPSVRGGLLEKAGRHEEASAQFERAAELATNEQEKELLSRRAEGRGDPPQTLNSEP